LELDTIWQTVLGEIEVTHSKGVFNTWFKSTYLLDYEDDSFTIGVVNVFAKKQFEDKFDKEIRDILNRQGYPVKEVAYKISSSDNQSSTATSTVNIQTQSSNEPRQLQSTGKMPSRLNEKYTFDNYIVGSSNELAYAACQAISTDPGSKYNPLFVYGGVGLGKTHLIQALGSEIRKNHPSMRVVYVTTETFLNEFLDHIRRKKKFSELYRKADVLIVDDIQFIAGKEKTQEEFFHTFNDLHQSNKQIILSSDRPPHEIPTLQDRLRSRFEWGMTIDIQAPEFETRCAILLTKAAERGVALPKETVELLASHFQTNVRELEGALNRVLAQCELRNLDPVPDVVSALLGDMPRLPKRVTPKQVVEKTARFFQINTDEIQGPKRDKAIVLPRQIAMYLMRTELHLSFPLIARSVGRKDHTTAMHSVDKITKAVRLDGLLRDQVQELREKLYV
jgi:chromosomal replication initiator protein